jgi:beta-mannosidase
MKTKSAILAAILFCGTMNYSAQSQNRISLDGSWTLTYWEQADSAITNPVDVKKIKTETITATVPGNVELDLLAANKINDPSIGKNIYDLRKYEAYQWMYTKHFSAPALSKGQKLVLDFEGIDCIADIWLNGNKIGSTDNAMVSHSFEISKAAKPNGDNLLQVILHSAVLEAQNYTIGTFSFRHYTESVWIRKPRHCYGWDIMPRLVSAGLWRDVNLIVEEPIRISDVNWVTVYADPVKDSVSAFVDVQARYPASEIDRLKLQVKLSRNGKTVLDSIATLPTFAFRTEFKFKNADLWWPKGYGEPALYDGTINLIDDSGKILATNTRKVGFRTIELERSEMNRDTSGKFCFIVNGERIFVRGTNWVPLDGFHSRDAKWVESTIDMVADLNCNMIRCWGGNVYEDTPFYDRCDREGIMIWQDFSMAGIIYPQDASFQSKIRDEIKSVVLKYRSHPCIAMWSGNNENDASLTWTLPNFHVNPNLDAISRKVIPEVLYEFDPTRPYLPSSPYYSQEAYDNGCKSNDLPENHLWGPRGYYKAPFYTTASSIFVSEIGYHGCPKKESLQKMFTKDNVYPWTKEGKWNDEWLAKSVRPISYFDEFKGRNDLMTNQIKLLFGFRPKTLEDFVGASQSTQAEAMKYFIERFRGDKFKRTGIIWWNVRDGWPIISDAIVDYYNSKKLAYYYIKNAQANVCVLMNDAVDGAYQLKAINDSRQDSKGKVTVTDVESGKVLYKGQFTVQSNGKTLIAAIPELTSQGVILMDCEIDGVNYKNHYLYGNPPFDYHKYCNWMKKTGIYDMPVK